MSFVCQPALRSWDGVQKRLLRADTEARHQTGAGSPCSMEEVALAVGEIIGHGSVKSAARMNSAVVLFLEKVEQVSRIVETTKITLSNVPPFISDEFLIKELYRHGKVVSLLRKVFSGCKSLLLSQVVSHHRQLFMILNNKDEQFDYRFRVHVDDFDYILYTTSFTVMCFGCSQVGHLIRAFPGCGAPSVLRRCCRPTPRCGRGGRWGGLVPRGKKKMQELQKNDRWQRCRARLERALR